MRLRVAISNFRCFKDFQIELGNFNVLIGPNDSGKTTLLQALDLAGATPQKIATTSDFWRKDSTAKASVQLTSFAEDSTDAGSVCVTATKPSNGFVAIAANSSKLGQDRISEYVGHPLYLHFDPMALKKPSPIVPQTPGMLQDGQGFATFLEEFLRENRQQFFDMENAFYRQFPQYKAIDVRKLGSQNGLLFVTKSGEEYSASEISDGTILYLAYLAVRYRSGYTRTLLIEEPENGIHYASLKQVVDTLKKLSETADVRVVMTTHSPFLLDMVEPEEVFVFQKDNEGAAHAKRLSEFPDVEEMKKDFMSGEIWTILGKSQNF